MSDNDIAAKLAVKEMKRQTDIFARAVGEALNTAAENLDQTVMLNAMVSATIIIQGEILAMLPPGKVRKEMRKAIETNLGVAIARAQQNPAARLLHGTLERQPEETLQ